MTPKLVGILNITPDSFSGDGCIEYDPTEILQIIEGFFNNGADYIDIGAESTAPGSIPVSPEEEQHRLAGLFDKIHLLSSAVRSQLMCDTRHVSTAQKAEKAGFGFINDVSGGRADRLMLPFIANSGLQYVMMYAKNESGRADLLDNQTNVFHKIIDFFDERLNDAYSIGIQPRQLILDPGMGAFVSIRPEDSLEIIGRVNELKKRYQRPLFACVSRKGFLGKLSSAAALPQHRVGASLALAAELVRQGVDYLRIHDLVDTRQFFDLFPLSKLVSEQSIQQMNR